MALPGLEPTSLQHGAHAELGSLCSVSVYNAGPERDSICRSWGQYHVETFDGLYYYLSGKGSYMLVGHHEPEGRSFSIQVRPPLFSPAGPCRLHWALGAGQGRDLPFSLSPAPGTPCLEGATVSKPLLTTCPRLPI